MTERFSIGDRVRVHLYNRDGLLFNTVEGVISDISFDVEVAPNMRKDLAWVTRIDGYQRLNDMGEMEEVDEGWFPLTDMEPLPDEDEPAQPRLFMN